MSQFSCSFSFGSQYHLKERFSPPRRALFPEFDKENNYQHHTLLSQKDVCFTGINFLKVAARVKKVSRKNCPLLILTNDFDKDDALLGSNEDNELNTPCNLVSADVDSFNADNRASNTVKKTNSDLNTWYRWCKSVKNLEKLNTFQSMNWTVYFVISSFKLGKYGQERMVITNMSKAALATFKRALTDTLHRLEEHTV